MRYVSAEAHLAVKASKTVMVLYQNLNSSQRDPPPAKVFKKMFGMEKSRISVAVAIKQAR